MRQIHFIVLMFFTISKIEAQKKLYDYSFSLKCNEIIEGVIDSRLNTIIDGRYFFNEDYNKSNIYKVTINEKESYYISKQLKKKIEKVIRKEKCMAIRIEKIGTEKSVKIIRH